MKITGPLFFMILFFASNLAHAADGSDHFIETNPKAPFYEENKKAEKPDGVRPQEGFVASAEVAVEIARAVLVPLYGQDVVDGELPLRATLQNGVWTIQGTLPHGYVGGTSVVQISKQTGEILLVTHGQ